MSEDAVRRIGHRFLPFLYDAGWTRVRVRVECEPYGFGWVVTFREMVEDRMERREAGLTFPSAESIRDYTDDEMREWAERAGLAVRPCSTPPGRYPITHLNPEARH